MARSARTFLGDFDDFRGNHQLDFTQLDQAKATSLLPLFQHSTPQGSMLDLYEGNHDDLCRATVYLYSQDKITHDQAVVVLEWVAIHKSAIPAKTYHLFDESGELNSQIYKVMLSRGVNKDILTKFINLAKLLPASDQCYYRINLSNQDAATNSSSPFVNLLTTVKVFFQTETKDDFFVLSASSRNMFTKALYGHHAKLLTHRLGMFDINDIERSVRRYSRYSAIYYPDTPYPPSFHGIVAAIFFVMMHDEAHRQSISSINNRVYAALIAAIDMVREKTGIKWSKEIWNSFDVEFLGMVYVTNEIRNPTNSLQYTFSFIDLISGLIASTQTPFGLFTPSPLNDTAWLLVIDLLVEPADKWMQYNINHIAFSYDLFPFHHLYSFVQQHLHDIKKLDSPAKQVVYIKQQYFMLGDLKDGEYAFQLDDKRCINATHNGVSLVLSKHHAMNLIHRSPNTHREAAKYSDELIMAALLSELSADILENLNDKLLYLFLLKLLTQEDLLRLTENNRNDLLSLLSGSSQTIIELADQQISAVRDVMQTVDGGTHPTVSYLKLVNAGKKITYAEFMEMENTGMTRVSTMGMFGGKDVGEKKVDTKNNLVLDL